MQNPLSSSGFSLDSQFIYVVMSTVVAILIFIEGQMVRKSHGSLPKSRFFYISSLIDTSWFFVSIAAMYLISFTTLGLAIPTAYGLYTIAGWIYGSRLMRQNGIPDDPREVVIPIKYVAFSQSFALIFFCLCLTVLLSLV